jgi:hypothetical protein
LALLLPPSSSQLCLTCSADRTLLTAFDVAIFFLQAQCRAPRRKLSSIWARCSQVTPYALLTTGPAFSSSILPAVTRWLNKLGSVRIRNIRQLLLVPPASVEPVYSYGSACFCATPFAGYLSRPLLLLFLSNGCTRRTSYANPYQHKIEPPVL